MPADLSAYERAVVSYNAVCAQIRDLETARNQAWDDGTQRATYDRYYEIVAASGVPAADADRYMAENFPAETDVVKAIEDAAGRYAHDRASLLEQAHAQLTEALAVLGATLGGEAVNAMETDSELTAAAAADHQFEQGAELVRSSFPALSIKLDPDSRGYFSDAVHTRIARHIGIDPKGRWWFQEVRAFSPDSAPRPH